MNFNHSLSHYILDNTTEAIFWRGIEYFKAGKTSDLIETDKKLNTVVKGSKPYNVEFRRGPKYIKGYCNCPYFQSNSDYCKHIVAVAVARDTELGLDLPNKEKIAIDSLQIDYAFGNKANEMFSDPLHADLEFLAKASDYSDWVRPHAKLPLDSRVREIDKPMKIKEISSAFEKIEKLEAAESFTLDNIRYHTGLKGKIAKKCNPVIFVDPQYKVRWVIVPFLVSVEGEVDLSIGKKYVEYRWVTLAELPKYSRLGYFEAYLQGDTFK